MHMHTSPNRLRLPCLVWTECVQRLSWEMLIKIRRHLATHQGVHLLSGRAQEDRAVHSGYQGFGGGIASGGGGESGRCRQHEHCRVDGTSCPWRTPPTPRKHRRGQGHAPGDADRALELMCYQGAVSMDAMR